MNADKKRETGPFFSIIVPTYNNERELETCVDSILAQSYPDFELIIVDDGSTDATPNICDAYAEKDDRVRIIHKKNQGVAAARNDGLFCAAGKYIYYADADDWIEQGLLQEAISVLAKPEPPDMFIFGYTRLLVSGERIACPWPLEPGLYEKERLKTEVYSQMAEYLGPIRWRRVIAPSLWDKIIAKDLLLVHHCSDTSLFFQEDLVCSYECVYFAEQIYFSSSNFYVYNQRSKSSMQQRYHQDLLKNNIAAADYLRDHLGDQGDALIDQQINELGFDGLMAAARQEIQFNASLWGAVRKWKAMLRELARFPVCPWKGLDFPSCVCVLLFSLRIAYPVFLATKSTRKLKRACWKLIYYHKLSDAGEKETGGPNRIEN